MSFTVATEQSNMNTEPLTPGLGAEVTGIDVNEISDEAFRALDEALARYGVLVMRDQAVSARQQLEFARRFGTIHYHPHVKGLPEQPEVMEILKREKIDVILSDQRMPEMSGVDFTEWLREYSPFTRIVP